MEATVNQDEHVIGFPKRRKRRPIPIDWLGRVVSEAKTSGSLTTWIAILLSFTITVATVFLEAGRVLDRLAALDDKIEAKDKLQIERENNQAHRIEELERRLQKEETKSEKLDSRVTSTRELVIASGGKLVPRESDDKEK